MEKQVEIISDSSEHCVKQETIISELASVTSCVEVLYLFKVLFLLYSKLYHVL